MKYIYFTRHGQTVWNVENKICGATDSPLTELGRQQAEELAQKICDSGIHIDEILYSPLSRAADTALIIAAKTGIVAREEKRLTEQNFGKWEGTARDGADFKESKKHFADSYEGGESMLRLAQRIYNLLDELKAMPDDKVVLLAAHNGIARCVNSYFHDMTNEEYASFGIRNCELVKYEF
ncbi:MAG: histidine phosphatase family protein [Lachnospiraceae bacterium]|jgi:probable phosphoglycerate mutase|nr:histidine phosphatase family protein [Lachnospiraceae bacterium]MCH4030164.1 histidine phosphatase family protein [Lachnospiraceae bacterium]MCH4107688.1 histidine phosphatase family protein [Lachnospiraceae bacterium]MCI1301461.1 histidine phosphatase family protein [Lachnospiraceae bacterium]MCI1330759.1 histidine phosphatase family protein [Lachnospiraceae bacterium]